MKKYQEVHCKQQYEIANDVIGNFKNAHLESDKTIVKSPNILYGTSKTPSSTKKPNKEAKNAIKGKTLSNYM